MQEIKIVKAKDIHFDHIWKIFSEVVKSGDSYVYDPGTTKDQAKLIWMNEHIETYVATINDEVVGSYIMKQNFPGHGSHVANCSYMVNPDFRGKGIGKLMGEHSIEIAKQQGFLSMQFNIVVSSNIAAVKLWQSLGFIIIGTSPKAFRHKQLGLIDTFIMHKSL